MLMLTITTTAFGKHIIGGEVYYECLGIDNSGAVPQVEFKIIFNMYRDCYSQGAAFDSPAQFGLYEGANNSWSYVTQYSASPTSIVKIDPNDDPCIEEPKNVCVEKGTYVFNIKVEVSKTKSYILAYQRCCRNNTILNIYDPGSTGAAFQVEITPLAQEICNDSPVFKNFPPVVICANTQLAFDHSATDKEGHELVYEFCNPLSSGGTLGTPNNPGDATSCGGVVPAPFKCAPPFDKVNFKGPDYSVDNPLGLNSGSILNTFSGLFQAVPKTNGQHVVGVCVKEYLNGELLSVVQRDFQFNVTTCKILVEADVKNDAVINEQEYLIRSCGSNTVDFVNKSIDEKYIDGYLWEFLINGEVVKSTEKDPSIEFPDIGEYYGQLIINPGSKDCSDTAKMFIQVYPEIKAEYSYEYDSCVSGPVIFDDKSYSGSGTILDWHWDLNQEDTIKDQNHNYIFEDPGVKDVKLTVTDINGCKDSLTQPIRYYPVPSFINIQPNKYIDCLPGNITFSNLSKPISDEYQVVWDFGDGQKDTMLSPTHAYNAIGVYTVKVEVTSPIGCYNEKEFPYLIKVNEGPEADFTYEPNVVYSNKPTVNFMDKSKDAVGWQYIFNEDASFYTPNPSYMFPDTGLQKVDLVVRHPTGCSDTITKYIDVIPVANLYFPNAFSPNGDGKNDVFKGKGDYFGVSNYSMRIYNRWGEQLFYSEDPAVGWDGKSSSNGLLAPTGVYVYQVVYKGPRGKAIVKKGYATLVR